MRHVAFIGSADSTNQVERGDGERSQLTAAKLVLPLPPAPSLNVQERMHWAARQRLREEYATAAWASWIQAGRPRFNRPEVLVRLFYKTRRNRDYDNGAGSIKPLMDGLKRHAFEDDNCDALTVEWRLEVDCENPRIEILIQEAGGDGAAEASAGGRSDQPRPPTIP